MLGFPTVLPCDVEGSPTPSITWLKDNQPIVSSPQSTYTRGGQALRLGSAQGDSTGLYTCRATNPAGTAIKHYSLSVLGKRLLCDLHVKVAETELLMKHLFFSPLSSVPPQIEGDPMSLTFGGKEEKVRINGTLTLSCLTKGFPEPKVNWFKDGQVSLSSQALHFLKPQTYTSKVIQTEQVYLYQPLLASRANCNSLNRIYILLHKPPPQVFCYE